MKNRKIILVVLMMGTLMASLDNSVVNVSLPTISNQFGSNAGNVKWIILAYMLGFCTTMPLVDWLSEKLGFFTLFISIVSIFTIASLLCGLSTNLPQLIAARVLQALGGGAISPTAMAMLSRIYVKEERGKAMGWWGLGSVVGPAIGPTLGGYLTREYGWPNIFFINVPIGVIAVVLSFFVLRGFKKQAAVAGAAQTAPAQSTKFDFGGFSWLLLFLLSFQYALSAFEKDGLAAIQGYAISAVAIIALLLFIRKEKRTANPVIDLALFQNKIYVRTLTIIFARSMALFGGLFLMPFLFQNYLRYNELQSGLFMLPISACMAFLLPISGKWADKYGSRNITTVALILLCLSNVILTFFSYPTGIPLILTATAVRGIGLGLLVSPLTSTAINSLSARQTTVGASVLNLFMQVAGSTGLAVLTLVATLSEKLFLRTQTPANAQYHSTSLAFWFAAGIVALAIIPSRGLPSIGQKKTSDKKVTVQGDNHLRVHAEEHPA
jgi:MFS transporter, DHA2 family, multidrug resistance protein